MKLPKDDLDKLLSDDDTENEAVERKFLHRDNELKRQKVLARELRRDKEVKDKRT